MPALLAAALLLVPAVQDPAPETGRPDSIEALLERVRSRRDELRAQLLPRVEALVADLEEIAGRNPAGERRIRKELGELGREALPLLLPWLDPGLPPEKGPDYRAAVVARTLREGASDALTDGLIQLSREATPQGQRLALSVLGHQPPDPRIDAHLEERFRSSEGFVRLECIRSLALRGGHGGLLRESLRDSDPEIVAAVLGALASRRTEEAAADVISVLDRPRTASQVLDELTEYFLACPAAMDEDRLERLLPYVLKEGVDDESRIKLLDAVPTFTKSLDLRQRRQLEPVLESPNSELREAALVCLTLLGHRPAKKELVGYYTKQIDDHGGYPKAYEDRADIYVRIQEYSAAVKDYKRSIEELGDRATLVSYRELWFKYGRALVQSGKLRQAMEALRDFGLGPEMRAMILADPAFAPLLESRYGRELR